MKFFSLKGMIKGWFIGSFTPSLFVTDLFEIAVKRYPPGAKEAPHMHKISTEYTLVVSGKISLNGKEYSEDDIIVIEPGEVSDFSSLTEAITCVVKIPSVKNDKYIVS
jgi:quercetin dioxygenase-like cupin family protein